MSGQAVAAKLASTQLLGEFIDAEIARVAKEKR